MICDFENWDSTPFLEGDTICESGYRSGAGHHVRALSGG